MDSPDNWHKKCRTGDWAWSGISSLGSEGRDILQVAALPRAVADVAAEEAGAGAGARGRLLPRLALQQLQVAVGTAGTRVPQQPAQLELVQAHLNKMIINLREKWQNAYKQTADHKQVGIQQAPAVQDKTMS